MFFKSKKVSNTKLLLEMMPNMKYIPSLFNISDECMEDGPWLNAFDGIEEPTTNAVGSTLDIIKGYIHERKY